MPEKPTPPSTTAIRESMAKAIGDLQTEIDAASGDIAASKQKKTQRDTDLVDAIAKAKMDAEKTKLTAVHQEWLRNWDSNHAVAVSKLEGLQAKKKETEEALADFEAQGANLSD